MKKVYQKKNPYYFTFHVIMKMGSSDNITGVSYADIGDDNHEDPSFNSRRRMGNIVVLLITPTLHCFPMIILITLYFQDIYANPLSLRVM